jgi:hypothetical protein
MTYLLILLLLIPEISFADIFSRPDNQMQWDGALANDAKNFYYRSGLDYNAYASNEAPYELQKKVSLGCNRYDFHESLKNLFTRPEFNNAELELLMQQLSTSRLLIWQYSSPTLADLYKHLETTGHLRLGIRYQQCEDLEKTVNDPTVALRKQAIMDCLRRIQVGSSGIDDIDLAFKSCFDSLHANGDLSMPYASLEDPGDGRSYVTGTVSVTDKTLDRVNKSSEDLTAVRQIIPRISVTNNTVTVQGPLRQSRELINSYRSSFISQILKGVKEYKTSRTVSSDLTSLSVFGVPMTEGQIKNFSLLDESTGYLAISKVASELAYLKTIDQYMQASQMLDRVMIHPAIEPGYKTLLKSSLEFVQKEIINLKEEKQRLGEYVQMMHAILDEADRQRLRVLGEITKESVSEQQKGWLKLNP